MCTWDIIANTSSGLAIMNHEKKKREREANQTVTAIQQDTERQIKEMNETMTNNGEAVQTNPTTKKRNTLSSLRLNMLPNTTRNNTTGLNI